mgnify:CR=1 FL=1|jgi:hypothetical protein
MRVSIATFHALPVWTIPWLTSPIAWDDACLLTCANACDIRHAVRASDGRVYDACALHNMFKLCGPSARVLHHETIDFVEAVPWGYTMAQSMWRCALDLIRTSPRLPTSKMTCAPVRAHMQLRVLHNNVHRAKTRESFGGKRGLKRHADSAFEPVAHNDDQKNKRYRIDDGGTT